LVTKQHHLDNVKFDVILTVSTFKTGAVMQVIQRSILSTRLGELAIHQVGDAATALVLWPSIFTDHQIFAPLAQTLAHRFRIVMIDGPSHGQSTGIARSFSMAECGGAMEDVMDQLSIERAVVGGTSWGGLVGAELALAKPHRVLALILMNTPFDLNRASPGLMARFISFGARWMLRLRLFRNGVAKSFFSARTLSGNQNYLSHFHNMLSSAAPTHLAHSIRSVLLESTPLFHRLSDISVPALLIAGKQDDMYPIDRQVAAALQMKNARFEPVSGKHISAIDSPHEVTECINRFFSMPGRI
jgi:3-oxoadipate enol-lactonase